MTYSNEIAKLNTLKLSLPRGADGRCLYTNEFRARAVELSEQYPICRVASDLGILHGQIRTWGKSKKLHGFKPSKAVAMSRKQPRDDSPVALLERQRTELAAKMVKIEQAIQLLRELGV